MALLILQPIGFPQKKYSEKIGFSTHCKIIKTKMNKNKFDLNLNTIIKQTIKHQIKVQLNHICLIKKKGSSDYYLFHFFALSILESNLFDKMMDNYLTKLQCHIFPFLKNKNFKFLLSICWKYLGPELIGFFHNFSISKIKNFSGFPFDSDRLVIIATQVVVHFFTWHGRLEVSLACLTGVTYYFYSKKNYLAIVIVWVVPTIVWTAITIASYNGSIAFIYVPEGAKRLIIIFNSINKFFNTFFETKDSIVNPSPKKEEKVPTYYGCLGTSPSKNNSEGGQNKKTGSDASESSEGEKQSSERAVAVSNFNPNPYNIPEDKEQRKHWSLGFYREKNLSALADAAKNPNLGDGSGGEKKKAKIPFFGRITGMFSFGDRDKKPAAKDKKIDSPGLQSDTQIAGPNAAGLSSNAAVSGEVSLGQGVETRPRPVRATRRASVDKSTISRAQEGSVAQLPGAQRVPGPGAQRVSVAQQDNNSIDQSEGFLLNNPNHPVARVQSFINEHRMIECSLRVHMETVSGRTYEEWFMLNLRLLNREDISASDFEFYVQWGGVATRIGTHQDSASRLENEALGRALRGEEIDFSSPDFQLNDRDSE